MYYLRTTPSAYPIAPQDLTTPPAVTIQSDEYEDIFGDLQLEDPSDSDVPICEACAA